jgi:hypothetical protein
MTTFFKEQNSLNPSGTGYFDRAEFLMMRRVFDAVCHEANVPIDAFDLGQRLTFMILDMAKKKPSEAELFTAALEFAQRFPTLR